RAAEPARQGDAADARREAGRARRHARAAAEAGAGAQTASRGDREGRGAAASAAAAARRAVHRRNHPRRQARARDRAPGAGVMAHTHVPPRVRARRFWLIVLLIAVFGGTIIHAGDPAENVTLTVGRSLVLDTGRPITRVSLTSAEIADALVTSASEL